MAQATFTYNGQTYIVDSDTSPPSVWAISGGTPVLTPPSSPEMIQAAVQALNATQARTAAQVAGGNGDPTAFPDNPLAGTATPPVFQGSNPALGGQPAPRTAAQAAGGGGAPTAFPQLTNPVANTATAPQLQPTGPTAPPVARTAAQVASGNLSPTGFPSFDWPQLSVPGVTLPTLTNPLANTATAPQIQTADPNAANSGNTARTAAQVASSGTGGASAPAAPAAAAAPAAVDTAAPADTTTSPNQSAIEKRILNDNGRGGWTVTGRTDEMKSQSVVDESGIPTTKLAPTGNVVWAINGPGGKNDVITLHPSATTPGDFEVVEPPKNLPAPSPPQGNENTGWYEKGDDGQWKLVIPPHTPNADEEIKKAVERQDAEAMRNEKAANQAAGRGYQTNSDYATMISQANKDKVSAATLAENIRQFDITQGDKNKQFDITRAAQDKVDAANIAKTGAETINLGATTAATQQATDVSKAKLPGDLAQQAATKAGTEATTAGTQATTAQTLQATQVAGAPALVGTPGGANVLTQRDPRTGAVIQNQMDLAYQPKTQADIAARVGQINSVMQAKSAQVQAKVGTLVNGKQFTPDDALTEFNTWYGANVAPQTESLKAAQDEAAFQRGKEQAAMRTSAMTAANATSGQMTEAFKAMNAAHPVTNPNFGAASAQLAQGKIPANINDLTWTGPNPVALAQQGAVNALKYIDPHAAAAAGVPPPNYQNMDISSMTRNPYAAPGLSGAPAGPPSGGVAAPVQPPAVAAAAPPVSPQQGQQSPAWWDGVMNRVRSDQSDQAIQAQAMPPTGGAGGLPTGLPPQPQPGEPIDAWRKRVMGGMSGFAPSFTGQ